MTGEGSANLAPLSLVLVGSFDRPRSWKHHIRLAALSLGWTVTALDDLTPIEEILAASEGADLFLWARFHGRNPAGDLDLMWKQLEAMSVAACSLHMDLYFGIPRRQTAVGPDGFWHAPTVFTADGDPLHAEKFRRAGVNHRWCPPAIGDDLCYRGEPRPEWLTEVAFTGSRTLKPWRTHRFKMLSHLRKRYGERFRQVHPSDGIWGHDLNDLNASVQVMVGDSANPTGKVENYWSDRIPWTLGRGGFLVHNQVKGMAEQGFVDGQTLATFPLGDFAELCRVIDRWLDDPDGRREITDRAMAVVKDRHTWTVRLTQIAEVML